MPLNTSDFGRCRLEGTSASTLLPNVVPPPGTLHAIKSGSLACKEIASDLRRGAARFAWLLGAASLVRLALERQYWSASYFAWLIVILVYAVLQHGLMRQPSPWRIRVALLANFLAIGVAYTMIGSALAAAPGWRGDGVLYQIERTVFGTDPQRFLAPWRTPWLSTMAILGYVSFVGFLLYLFLAEAFWLNRSTGRLQLGLMSLYGIGYASYLLFPAAGPVFYHPALLPPIVHSPVSAYLSAWVIRCCSRVDAWPSLHAAVCCFALIWTFHRHRRVFLLLIFPGAALMLGTVYFQFHYFIDLLAGCLIGTLALRPVFAAVSIPLKPRTNRPSG